MTFSLLLACRVPDPLADGGTTSATTPTGPTTEWIGSPPVDPALPAEEQGLPVLYVTTTAAPTDDQAPATVTWQGAAYPALLKVHGRTSTHYPKRSYALEFDGPPLPVPSWGVARDHLLLISTFDDNSYVRQAFTYALWAELAASLGETRLAPRHDFVVLYLDGAYVGLYLLLDRVDDEFVAQMGFDRDADLYKAVDPDANFYLTDQYGKPKETLHQGYEKEEGLPEDDFGGLEGLVGWTGAADAHTLVTEAEPWLDLGEFMDWYLLVHYANAEDSTNKNNYLLHAREDGRFRYVPWDFNASWGQNWRTYRRDPDVENEYRENNRIFAALLEDADASAALWARFAAGRTDGPWGLGWQRDWLDATYARIDAAAADDWAVWAADYAAYDEWAEYRAEHGDLTDYEGEKRYLYDWVDARAAYFDTRHP